VKNQKIFVFLGFGISKKVTMETSKNRATIPDFAIMVDMHDQSVRAAIKGGRISKGVFKEGNKTLINPLMAAREWGKEFVGQWAHLNEEAPGDNPASADDKTQLLNDARLEEQQWKAEFTRLRAQKLEGSLVDKMEVALQLGNWGTEMREELLRIPDQITDQLIIAARTKTRREFHAMLYEALEKALLKMTEIAERDLAAR
jgi:hypothetical protein